MTAGDTRTSEAAGQSSSGSFVVAALPASAPKYVAVRVCPQTTTDGCVRIDRTLRPTVPQKSSPRSHS